MNTRTPVAALAPVLLLALVLWVGEAAAQSVCRGGTHTGGGIITCIEGAGSSADILVDPGSLGINHPTANIVAVEGNHSGSGDVELRMTAGSVVTTGTAGHGLYAEHAGATGGGAIVIRMSGGSVETRGSNAYAIRARRASGTGNVRIDVTGGSLSRTGGTGGVVVGRHAGTGNVTINMSSGATLAATGAGVGGLTGTHSGTGDLTVSLIGGSVMTTGVGVGATRSNAATVGNVAVTVSHANSVVKTTGARATGVSATNNGSGDATITMRDGLVETTGAGALGLNAYSPYTGTSPGTVSIVLEGGTVRTRGGIHTFSNVNFYSHGVYSESNNGRGDVSVRMTGGAVETAGASANGIFVVKRGPAGAGSIEMTGGTVTTAGDGAYGAYVMHGTGASTEGLSIDAAGAVSVVGLNARGLLGVHTGLGSATVRTRAAAEIAAPFAIGVEGRLTNDDSAAGRIVVTHGGAAEAREIGVLAWAARSSGHTMGSGATMANDAARTTPMIHVTSSGDVTVGASVTDAFIRARIAGADEALSTGEQAVLSAITAGDSDALTTALAALPAAYDAAWKAEAQNLLRKRAAAPTGDEALAYRAAEEILDLARTGVRAVALSHTAIADHVRADDALSDAERTVLDAVLTKGAGSELETALTALTGATYTTAWKNTVRRLAATYNAGDIQVDVTGGSITAEGNGVEALYAVPHDSNGAITVTVAEGARVTGGAKGLYVRGAGAGAGSFRAQSVTVDGRVTGGTGAGVHMAGGGRLAVGRTGRVGATSGVGVLSDGAGDLHATVAGTVEGDVQVQGGGSLTLNVMEGGAVTGMVRDPVGPLTVAGRIGRLLYTNGGTVTVAATGALTGVEVDGKIEALRSESGDLSLTVADKGMVTGDVQARGGGDLSMTVAGMVTGDVLGLGDGDHRVTVAEGGSVTGTVRLAASTVRVAGVVGRVQLDRGGTVTVDASGRVTGVEGVGIRSETGDLAVTVAGVVMGDILALGSGEHAVSVAPGGAVTGTVRVATEGTVRVAGVVGRVQLDRGGTVTVDASGRVTGVEGVGIRSPRGELVVSFRQAPGETAEQLLERIQGTMRDADGAPEVRYVSADGRRIDDLGVPGSARSAPIGAYDLGIVADGDGVRLDRAYAPRSRVYEALPSVLLGLNRLPEFRERAARAPGGGWAQVEAFRGKWDAAGSTTPGLEYGYRRHGLRAGFDAAVTENGLFGVSAHRRGGSADVSDGGRMDLSGAGVGVSWASRFADAAYMDLKAEWTWYEADLFSSLRGALKKKARARGHALGVEIGRRAAAGGLVLTPRVQMVRSTVSAKGFTDAVGARVSPTGGRSLTGAAGVAAELDAAPGTRVFGALDAEREFSAERKVRVSGEELRSSADAMWFRVRLGGAHAWNDGRYAFRGEASYATAGDSREFGGGVGLRVRF